MAGDLDFLDAPFVQLLLTAVDEAVLVLSEDGLVLYANDRANALLGGADGAMLGRTVTWFVRAALDDVLPDLHEIERSANAVLTRRVDVQELRVVLDARTYEHGHTRFMVLTAREEVTMTDREHLQRCQDSLRRAEDALAATRDRVGRAATENDAAARLLYAAALDLRNVMARLGQDDLIHKMQHTIGLLDDAIKAIQRSTFALPDTSPRHIDAERVADAVRGAVDGLRLQPEITIGGSHRVDHTMLDKLTATIAIVARYLEANNETKAEIAVHIAEHLVLTINAPACDLREALAADGDLHRLHADAEALGGTVEAVPSPASTGELVWSVPNGHHPPSTPRA